VTTQFLEQPWASAEKEGYLVNNIRELGSREAGRAPSDLEQILLVLERDFPSVYLEDRLAPTHVRQADFHVGVKSARPGERRVKHLGKVGRCDDDDLLGVAKAIQLDQQLVQRHLRELLVFGRPLAAHGVDLVHKDDTRRLLLGCSEKLPDPPGADANKHLIELRARRVEERHPGLTRDGFGEQRLARARWARQQDALWELAAKPSESVGVLEEPDYLLELAFGLLSALNVVERDLLRHGLGFDLLVPDLQAER